MCASSGWQVCTAEFGNAAGLNSYAPRVAGNATCVHSDTAGQHCYPARQPGNAAGGYCDPTRWAAESDAIGINFSEWVHGAWTKQSGNANPWEQYSAVNYSAQQSERPGHFSGWLALRKSSRHVWRIEWQLQRAAAEYKSELQLIKLGQHESGQHLR